MAMGVKVRTLDEDAWTGLEGRWRALERRAGGSPYQSWEWLSAWRGVYRPNRLSSLEVEDSQAGVVALGLIEGRSAGRWRFAGHPVTPKREILCVPGASEAAWSAIADWLAAHPREVFLLEAEGISSPVPSPLRMGTRPGAPVYRLELPPTFDEYLAARPATIRKGLKQKLRRLDRARGHVHLVDPDDWPAALADFVRLHAARARSKGERHPAIGNRLVALLQRLGESGPTTLRIFELRVDRARVGVTVRLDSGSTAHFYNAGFDPSQAWMGPGIVLELASIRDSIDRQLAHFDLGPGTFRYKTDLGAKPTPRFDLTWTPASTPGHAVKIALDIATALRQHGRPRRVMQRWRSHRATDSHADAGLQREMGVDDVASLPHGLGAALTRRGVVRLTVQRHRQRGYLVADTPEGQVFARFTTDPADEPALSHEARIRAIVGDTSPLRAPPVLDRGARWMIEPRLDPSPPRGRKAMEGVVIAAARLGQLELPGLPPSRSGRARARFRRAARLVRSPLPVTEVARARRLLARSTLPTVTIHGDFHAGNLIGGEDGPWVIDWELTGRGPAGADLMRLWTTLDRADDRQHLLEGTVDLLGASWKPQLARLRYALLVQTIIGKLESPGVGGQGPDAGVLLTWLSEVRDEAGMG